MKIVQVFTCGVDFVGELASNKDGILSLKNAAEISRRVVPGGKLEVKCVLIEKNPDYLTGNMRVSTGPGVLIFDLSEDGPTAQQYRRTVSNLIIPNIAVNSIQ